MNILPHEVASVTEIGTLDDSPVRILKTIGGFHIAMGRLKNKKQEEVLAAGSHPAIVKHNVKKAFANFQQSLTKSEPGEEDSRVTGFSELLPSEMRSKGYDLLMLEKSEETSFVLSRFGNEVNSFNAKSNGDSIQLTKSSKPINSETAGFSRAAAVAAAVKALNDGKSYVDHDGVRFEAAKIMSKR